MRGGPQVIPRPAGARVGPGPAWASPRAPRPGRVDVAMVRAAMARPAPEDPDGLRRHALPFPSRPSAVLCAVFDEVLDGVPQAHVVLTRRAGHLRTHTGEVSFPGGRLEAGETALDAARREAEEEVGLDPAAVEVLGLLSPMATLTSGSVITPFVAALPRRPALVANPAEVAAVLTVPLVELWSPEVHREELWPVEGGAWRPVTFFDLVGDTVWGATGWMLRELLDRIWALSAGGARPGWAGDGR